jgi:hypothetical protein
MAGENNKIALVDGNGSGLEASVVPVLSDPTKNAVVVTNADGTPVGGTDMNIAKVG